MRKCTKKSLKELQIYDNNKDLIDNIIKFYNNWWIKDYHDTIIELRNNNSLDSFFLDDNKDIGKTFKDIYNIFIKK